MVVLFLCLVIVCHGSASGQQPEATSLFGKPLYKIPFTKLQTESNELLLTIAEQAAALQCADPARSVWIGRRQAYAWNYTAAVGTFSGAIAADPDNAPLRRHRGHRHLTRRNFTLAEADLSKAVELMDKSPGRAPQWEADGQPNALNIPLSTLQFNAYYHLGLARYLQGDFGGALAAYQACYNYSGINDESLQATAYWRCTAMRHSLPCVLAQCTLTHCAGRYMAMRRAGASAAAANESLKDIHPGMRALEGAAYLNLTLMFQGRLAPEGTCRHSPQPSLP